MPFVYEVRVTFEDGTRINFTGEGITEIQAGNNKMIRLRHTKLVTEVSQLFKQYIREVKAHGDPNSDI